MRYLLAVLTLFVLTAAFAEEAVLRPGETLEALAERAMGQAGLWRLLLAVNEDLDGRDPQPGDALTLPGPEVGWAELVAGDGLVTVGRGHGGFEPLHTDTAIAPGDTARTGELSTAELSVGGARVVLAPSTGLRLEGSVRSQGASSTLLELLYGRVRAVLDAVLGEGDEFRVGGPTAVAIVRGTDFEVASPDPGVTQIAVFRGRVRVEPRFAGEPAGEPVGEPFELGPGEGAIVREHGVVRVALPAEPSLLRPEDGASLVFAADARRGVVFEWEAPAGATRVRFQLAADPACVHLYEEREAAAGEKLRLELPPGAYWWRAAALDDDGLAGEFSPARSFEVVVDDTPPDLEIQGWRLGGGGRTLTLWGRTVDAANLVVGAGPVPLDGDGGFEATVPTAAYDGSVPLVARDAAGNSREYRLVFHIPDLPVGLVGPAGGLGLSMLASARGPEPWSVRVVLGADYRDWLVGSTAPGYTPLERAVQPWLAVSLGLGGWGEFSVKAPYVNQIFSDGETFAGMGDLTLEGKLSPPSSGDFAYALYARLALPTGPTYLAIDEPARYRPPVDLGPETPDGIATPTVGLALEFDFLKGGVLANLGYDLAGGGGFEGGLGLIWAATDWFTLSLESQYGISTYRESSLIPGFHFRVADLELSLTLGVPLGDDGSLETGLAVVLFEL
jgi:hypothetical protein